LTSDREKCCRMIGPPCKKIQRKIWVWWTAQLKNYSRLKLNGFKLGFFSFLSAETTRQHVAADLSSHTIQFAGSCGNFRKNQAKQFL
jgi:hypothetical protein